MRVLISGAGVSGPAVAYFLARAGAHITVVDKAPALLSHGQNIDINGSAVAVVKKMGVLDQVHRWNTTEKGGRLVHENDHAYALFPQSNEGGHRFSPTNEFEILRGDLARVLYEPTAKHPNVKYLFATTVKEVLSNDEKSVKVELSNGDIEEYDALVVSDGQWSRLRKQHFAPEDLTVRDTNMYAAYFTIPRLPEDNDYWNIHAALGSRIVTTRPDPHSTYRGMFTKMPCNAAEKRAWQEASRGDRKTQQDLLRREFGDLGWQTPRLLNAMSQAPDFYFQALQQIKMARWSSGRIVLAGDSAWCPTPLTGMGASLAINGAYVLAGELSKLEEGEHPRKAFEEYDRVFRPWVEEQQKIYSVFPGCVHPETAFQRRLLVAALWTLGKVVERAVWIVKAFGFEAQEEGTEDFKLPQYPKFEDSQC